MKSMIQHLTNCFTEDHGICLLPEFIEELVESKNRKLARQVWFLMSTSVPTHAACDERIKEVGQLFVGSESREDLEALYQTFVNHHWPRIAYNCPAYNEINAMEDGK